MSELKFLSDQEVKQWCKNGVWPEDVVVIDVREPDEYQREHIPGSKNIPLSKLRTTDFSADVNKTAVFHCRSGHRTKMSKDVISALGFKQTFCLPEGLHQWKRCEMPLIENKQAPIDIMRQVQITAGILILTSVLLSLMISPYYMLISGFIGVGILHAGVTGTCAMATLLAVMPWNR